jgi:hypothetical protein
MWAGSPQASSLFCVPASFAFQLFCVIGSAVKNAAFAPPSFSVLFVQAGEVVRHEFPIQSGHDSKVTRGVRTAESGAGEHMSMP